MTESIKFSGKVVGNNLRKDYLQPTEYMSSQVKFEGDTPWSSSFTVFEIRGQHAIGTKVNVTVSFEE